MPMAMNIIDLGYGPSDEEAEQLRLIEAAEDAVDAAEEVDESYIELDPEMAGFVDELCKRTVIFAEELWGESFYPYQRVMSYRIVESLVLQDAEEITGLLARQSGKSEVVATTLAACMILFPILAKTYPILARFKRGVWVGLFAPVDEQSELVYRRIIDRLTSERAAMVLGDPEIALQIDAKSRVARLTNGSFCRRQTANPRAKIEGSTYHIIVIDEAQDADTQVVRKSIHPMLAATGGSMVKIGTPGFVKGDFYDAINLNKRRAKGKRSYHFEYDHKTVSKYNPAYKRFIEKEKMRLGEDSEEFQMSYCVAPETRILTADLRHIPARDVFKGMKLVGFDEDRPDPGVHRRFREAVVEDVGRITRPCYRLGLSDGTSVTCSAEHQWLVLTPGGLTVWKKTQDLGKQRYQGQRGRDRIFKLTEVWSDKPCYEVGYLAAAFDGEGHLSGAQLGDQSILGFSQRENAMLFKVRKFLTDWGFQSWERVQPSGVVTLGIAGGRAEIMRFLGQIRPQRLLEKVDINRLGSIGRHDRRSGGFDHPEVVSCEFVGEQEVIAIRTSTRTYVAEGLASHNCLKWMLDRGMLITEDDLDYLADKTMTLQKAWHRTPCVVGIDPARIKDSTVVTVMWVDWDHPDPAGYREHRILNWLEIHNTAWEEQYFEIMDFLEPYNISHVAVDGQGMGSAVADRMQRLLGHRCEVLTMNSDAKTQTERWKHLIQLIQRQMFIYPGHSKARRTKVWRRFRQQFSDAEKVMQGQYLLIQAPDEREAHDDYVDSAALACACTLLDSVPSVEVLESPFYR